MLETGWKWAWPAGLTDVIKDQLPVRDHLGLGAHVGGRTQVVPEGQVQQSQQGTELDQLSLHALHLLLKVLVLHDTNTQ